MNKTIDKAVSICGSRKKLAEYCSVSNMTVGNWLRGCGIKVKHLSLISEATNGEISVDEIIQSLTAKQHTSRDLQ